MRLRRTELFGATAIFGGALIAFACSGGEDYPSYTSTGGSSNANTGGVQSSTGGTTGGAAPSTGGTVSTGGVQATGGTTGGFATGGSSTGGFSTGGSTGGTAVNTGGSKSTGGFGGKAGTGGSGGKAGTGGSTSTGGSGGGATVAFSQVVTFIKSTCEPCHDGTTMPNFTTANATTLYNTLTTFTVPQCGGNKLVTANDTSKSALLMVGTGKCSGLKMPSGCTTTTCFAANDITLLTNWIQSGAKNP